MMLSEKTTQAIRNARENSPELAEALDEISEVLIGVMGATDTAAHIDRPLNDTGEHQTINAVLDAVGLAGMALEAVYMALE